MCRHLGDKGDGLFLPAHIFYRSPLTMGAKMTIAGRSNIWGPAIIREESLLTVAKHKEIRQNP
jgi:hypothetical protein